MEREATSSFKSPARHAFITSLLETTYVFFEAFEAIGTRLVRGIGAEDYSDAQSCGQLGSGPIGRV